MTGTPPVTDWARDYDIFDPDYVVDPYIVWDDLRQQLPDRPQPSGGAARGCPPPTRRRRDRARHRPLQLDRRRACSTTRTPTPRRSRSAAGGIPVLPPISVDPPMHTWTRRLMLPWFSHRRVEEMEVVTRDLVPVAGRRLRRRGPRRRGSADYAQQIPVRIISLVLGVPEDMSDTFTGWVRDVLEFAHDERRREAGAEAVGLYLYEQVQRRKTEPGDDLISELLHTEVEGEQITDEVVLGIAALTFVAGVDTTWSAIGSSLWHLATHPTTAADWSPNPS
jgi:cytochrome P450